MTQTRRINIKPTTGPRNRHTVEIGDKVNTRDRRTGKVVGPGLGGTVEVEFDDGSRMFCATAEVGELR